LIFTIHYSYIPNRLRTYQVNTFQDSRRALSREVVDACFSYILPPATKYFNTNLAKKILSNYNKLHLALLCLSIQPTLSTMHDCKFAFKVSDHTQKCMTSWNDVNKFARKLCKANITTLDASNNCLSKLGKIAIRRYSKLSYLTLHGNKISDVNWEAFSGLKHISYIDLRNNQLRYFPNFTLLHISLTRIQLDNNQITNTEDDANVKVYFVKLQQLTISNNKLTRLPNIVYHAKQLSWLSLENNWIKVLPNLHKKCCPNC